MDGDVPISIDGYIAIHFDGNRSGTSLWEVALALYIHNSVQADVSFIVGMLPNERWFVRSYFTPAGELAQNWCNQVFNNNGQGYDKPELALLAAQYHFGPQNPLFPLDEWLADPERQDKAMRQIALALVG